MRGRGGMRGVGVRRGGFAVVVLAAAVMIGRGPGGRRMVVVFVFHGFADGAAGGTLHPERPGCWRVRIIDGSPPRVGQAASYSAEPFTAVGWAIQPSSPTSVSRGKTKPNPTKTYVPRKIPRLHRGLPGVSGGVRTLCDGLSARRRCEDDGTLHRTGSQLRGYLRFGGARDGARVGVCRARLPALCGDLRCLRRGMRQAQDGSLPALRGGVPQVCRSVPRDGRCDRGGDGSADAEVGAFRSSCCFICASGGSQGVGRPGFFASLRMTESRGMLSWAGITRRDVGFHLREGAAAPEEVDGGVDEELH